MIKFGTGGWRAIIGDDLLEKIFKNYLKHWP